MFEDYEERGRNEVLRKLSREIWLKMVDTVAGTPIGKRESDIDQTIRSTKFEAYGEIRDLVESMITDKKEDTLYFKSYAVSDVPDHM